MGSMQAVTHIDFSNTINYQHRSDLCLSTKAILSASVDKNVLSLDLDRNFLDIDGARAFNEFIAKNSTLRIFKANNCSLGAKSCEMMV
jgi:hypothetical protein